MRKTTRQTVTAIVATALLTLIAVGCTSTTAPSSQDAQTTQTETEKTGSGALGDYAVEIGDYTLTKTYDGKDAIVITMKYTNNSDESTSYMSSLMARAFQDGVELSTAIIMDDSYDSESQMKELKTGASIDIQVAYELSNTTSDVEFEVEEFISFNDAKVEKTFAIAQ